MGTVFVSSFLFHMNFESVVLCSHFRWFNVTICWLNLRYQGPSVNPMYILFVSGAVEVG